MALYPFMFYLNRKQGGVLVIIASYGLVFADCQWMNDPRLDENTLVPSVDLSKEEHLFATEAEALGFIKQWWARQS